MTNAIAIAAWALSAILVSELFGYPLHRLLHTGFIHFLSKNHMSTICFSMVHCKKQRPNEEHLDATTGQVALGIGLEWIIPAGILLIVLAGVFCFLRVGLLYQFLFFAIVLAWTVWVFSYLHDRMRHQGLVDGAGSHSEALVLLGPQAARHSSQRSERPRTPGQELRHRFRFFRLVVRHHGIRSASV